MPLSWHGQLVSILDAVLRREPGSVLDIGCGHGAYGMLIGQYLPGVIVDGVDADVEAITQLGCRRAYRDVVRAPWPAGADHLRTDDYDLALMIDVIEHAELELGASMIHAALDHARALVIATPHDPMQWPQDDLPNPYERHVRRWTLEDVISFGGRAAEAHHLAESIVVVLER